MLSTVKSIALWGDSILKGVIFDSLEKRYRTLKNSSADLSEAEMGVGITNNSRFGCTVTKGYKNLRIALDKDPEWDTAIIEYGGNDSDFDWRKISDSPDDLYSSHTALDVFTETYQKIIDLLLKRGIRPVILSLPPIDPVRYFEKISQGLSAQNILKWLGDKFKIYRYHEQYSLAATKLALENRCHYIGVREAFLSHPDTLSLICEDGIHINENGHRLMFETFMEYVKKLGIYIPGRLAADGA